MAIVACTRAATTTGRNTRRSTRPLLLRLWLAPEVIPAPLRHRPTHRRAAAAVVEEEVASAGRRRCWSEPSWAAWAEVRSSRMQPHCL